MGFGRWCFGRDEIDPETYGSNPSYFCWDNSRFNGKVEQTPSSSLEKKSAHLVADKANARTLSIGLAGETLGKLLGPYWDHIGTILGTYWEHTGNVLGTYGELLANMEKLLGKS